MKVKGTGSRCELVEHVKDNYYARSQILAIIGREKHTLVFYST